MTKSKKGISPLIATVLILGLTVVLAALVAMWSTQFAKDTTKSVEETASTQMTCSRDVSFDIRSVCKSGNLYKMTVANDGTVDIIGFKVRLFQDSSNVDTQTVSEVIVSYGIKPVSVTPAATITAVKRVELLPMINVPGGKTVTCSSTESYGDVNGADITEVCPS